MTSYPTWDQLAAELHVALINGKLTALDWVLTQLNKQKEPSHA